MDLTSFLSLLAVCAPLVHPDTASALVAAESSFNRFAIGVVGGRLERQPRGLAEALANQPASAIREKLTAEVEDLLRNCAENVI